MTTNPKVFFSNLLKQLQKSPRVFFGLLDKFEAVKQQNPREFYGNEAYHLPQLFLAERVNLEMLDACPGFDDTNAESKFLLERFENCPSVVEYFAKSSCVPATLSSFVKLCQSDYPHLEESLLTLSPLPPIEHQDGTTSTLPTTVLTPTQVADAHGSRRFDKKDSPEPESRILVAGPKEICESSQAMNVDSQTRPSSRICSNITSGVGRNRARYISEESSGVFLLDVQLTHRNQLKKYGRRDSWRGAQTRAAIWISRFGPTSSIYEMSMRLKEELEKYAQEHMKTQWTNRTTKKVQRDSDMDSPME